MKTNKRGIRPGVLFFCGLFLVVTSTLIWLLPKRPSSHPVVQFETPTAAVETSPPPVAVTAVQAPAGGKPPLDWGMEVVGLYPAVGGRVLDLRYKILDPVKAALLPNEPGGIYLIDEATGATTKLPNSPKTGSIPQNPQKLEAGRTYSFSFPNQGGRFKSGNKVTLVIGNFRAENLSVQ